VPDHAIADIDLVDDYALVALEVADVGTILSGAGASESVGLFYARLRSGGNEGVGDYLSLATRLRPEVEADVNVTCSVYVRRHDDTGTSAIAKMSCFGAETTVALPKEDQGWHRLSVTTPVINAAAISPRVVLYGSGAATGGDQAWLRYAMPKVEYGQVATAWNAGGTVLGDLTVEAKIQADSLVIEDTAHVENDMSINGGVYMDKTLTVGGTVTVNGTLETGCTIKSCSGTDWVNCSCDDGYYVSTGGCHPSSAPHTFQSSYPMNLTTWRCGGHGGTKTATVLCCRQK